MEYCLMDADGNGTEDLILGRNGNINAIWTMKNGKTAGLQGSWAQGYLCEGYIFEFAVREDGSHYHALGNSVAIPCVAYVMRGIALVLQNERRSAGS